MIDTEANGLRGVSILLAFFSLFTVASLLIPSPMFPGNFFCDLIGTAFTDYANYLSAVFNGIFYGAILWCAFFAINRKLGEEK